MRKIIVLAVIFGLLSSCRTTVNKTSGSEGNLVITYTPIRDVKVTFLENKYPKNESLEISFSRDIPVKFVKIIAITGKELGENTFDGRKVNKIVIPITPYPEGPHMFKILMDGDKEINEIFRIKNTRGDKH